MKKYFWGIVFALAAQSCGTKNKSTISAKSIVDTAKYFSLSPYFKEQAAFVDLRNFNITQQTIIQNKTTSIKISKEAYLKWNTLFITEANWFEKNKNLFKENVFKDLSTQSYTLNYTPFDYTLSPIQNIDILLSDETNLPKRIFIKKVFNKGDTTITEHFNWKTDKSFQLTSFRSAPSGFSQSTLISVNWNDK